MLKIDDYLCNPEGFDWRELLKSWQWILPNEFTVWFLNRFGNLFLVLNDGSVHLLDTGEGSLRRVAGNAEEFLIEIDQEAEEFLYLSLVDTLTGEGVTLERNECFSFVVLPGFGGDKTRKNVKVRSLQDHLEKTGRAFGPEE